MTDVKRVFVTVGTTKFDALIEALDTDVCMAQLAARGYSHVLMQIGHGTHTPAPRDDDPRFPSVEFFRHDPQYKRHVEAADLVISHAGAGSIMDALSMHKKIVVVVNTLLMDNHQAELADAMAAQNYCIATTCEELAATLKTADLDALVPYPEPDESAFPRLVDQVMSSDTSVRGVPKFIRLPPRARLRRSLLFARMFMLKKKQPKVDTSKQMKAVVWDLSKIAVVFIGIRAASVFLNKDN